MDSSLNKEKSMIRRKYNGYPESNFHKNRNKKLLERSSVSSFSSMEIESWDNSSTSSLSWFEEYDQTACEKVAKHLDIVEQVLYDEMDGSVLKKHLREECNEWKRAFPHFRIRGKTIPHEQSDQFAKAPIQTIDLPAEINSSDISQTSSRISSNHRLKPNARQTNQTESNVEDHLASIIKPNQQQNLLGSLSNTRIDTGTQNKSINANTQSAKRFSSKTNSNRNESNNNFWFNNLENRSQTKPISKNYPVINANNTNIINNNATFEQTYVNYYSLYNNQNSYNNKNNSATMTSLNRPNNNFSNNYFINDNFNSQNYTNQQLGQFYNISDANKPCLCTVDPNLQDNRRYRSNFNDNNFNRVASSTHLVNIEAPYNLEVSSNLEVSNSSHLDSSKNLLSNGHYKNNLNENNSRRVASSAHLVNIEAPCNPEASSNVEFPTRNISNSVHLDSSKLLQNNGRYRSNLNENNFRRVASSTHLVNAEAPYNLEIPSNLETSSNLEVSTRNLSNSSHLDGSRRNFGSDFNTNSDLNDIITHLNQFYRLGCTNLGSEGPSSLPHINTGSLKGHQRYSPSVLGQRDRCENNQNRLPPIDQFNQQN